MRQGFWIFLRVSFRVAKCDGKYSEGARMKNLEKDLIEKSSTGNLTVTRDKEGAIIDVVFNFGSYNGFSVFDIADENLDYLHWVIDNIELPSDVYSFVEGVVSENSN